MPTPSVSSSSSPTPSTVSRTANQNMASIKEVLSESEPSRRGQKENSDLKSVFGTETGFDDSDDDDILICSGEGSDGKSVGLFDVVKREFRVRTAEITNRPDFGPVQRRPKVNFIQVSVRYIGRLSVY